MLIYINKPLKDNMPYYNITSKMATELKKPEPFYIDSSKIKTNIDALSIDTSNEKKNFNFIFTYKGRSIEDDHYKQMTEQMKALKADSIKIFKLGFDGDYTLKQKIYPDYPEYTFYLYKYYGIKSKFMGLKIWEKNKL